MNRFRHLACILGALAASMLTLGAPAFATEVPPPGTDSNHPRVPGQVTTHLVVARGMPGWQITLIAAAAALTAATLAMILHRARTHRHPPVSTA